MVMRDRALTIGLLRRRRVLPLAFEGGEEVRGHHEPEQQPDGRPPPAAERHCAQSSPAELGAAPSVRGNSADAPSAARNPPRRAVPWGAVAHFCFPGLSHEMLDRFGACKTHSELRRHRERAELARWRRWPKIDRDLLE